MAIVIPAEGAILERVFDTAHSISSGGLSRHTYAQFAAAQMRTAWGRRHQRRLARVERNDVLASATQYDLAAILNQRRVRVCGIGAILPQPTLSTGGPARELVDWLLEQAADEGAEMALIFSETTHEDQPPGFDMVPMTDVELRVAEPSRRGAPMTLIRGGEERDLAAIVAMGRVRASPFRFHLDRDADFVQHAITKKRLLAGLGAAGARQLHVFIAEEGITAAAYVVVSIVGARGPLRSAATVILPVRASAPFYRRSSHVNRSSAARRSGPGSLPALSLRRSRLYRRSPRQAC